MCRHLCVAALKAAFFDINTQTVYRIDTIHTALKPPFVSESVYLEATSRLDLSGKEKNRNSHEEKER